MGNKTRHNTADTLLRAVFCIMVLQRLWTSLFNATINTTPDVTFPTRAAHHRDSYTHLEELIARQNMMELEKLQRNGVFEFLEIEFENATQANTMLKRRERILNAPRGYYGRRHRKDSLSSYEEIFQAQLKAHRKNSGGMQQKIEDSFQKAQDFVLNGTLNRMVRSVMAEGEIMETLCCKSCLGDKGIYAWMAGCCCCAANEAENDTTAPASDSGDSACSSTTMIIAAVFCVVLIGGGVFAYVETSGSSKDDEDGHHSYTGTKAPGSGNTMVIMVVLGLVLIGAAWFMMQKNDKQRVEEDLHPTYEQSKYQGLPSRAAASRYDYASDSDDW